LFFLAAYGYSMADLNKMCNKQSGLLGISDISNDMRTLITEAEKGNDRAQLALDIFCYRIKKYIGMYSAVLGRVDAIVFTGGIGENRVSIREACCKGIENLGVSIDLELNAATVGGAEGPVSTSDSPVKVLVVPTDEEAAIAGDTYQIVSNK